MTSTRTDAAPRSWLDVAALVAVVVALGFAFLSPPDANQGEVARLFYVHLPVILGAYAAFLVNFAASAVYLGSRKLRWDHWAVAGAEVGVVLTGLTLGIGMLWAKPTWGVFWTWSARLTLTAIMFFVYLGYLTLRRASTDSSSRAFRSAVFGMLAIIQIPLIHFSVQIWRDIHQQPTVLRPDGAQIDDVLRNALLAGIIAYGLVTAALIRRRYHLARIQALADERLEQGDGGLAGEAISPPSLPGDQSEVGS
jgi:heme exporter protein C